MEISEDTKLFLRAVLVSLPGMPQSHVMKEYYQTTGERIQYSKYGFKTLYDFLVALEGEVTRLEFSPKHGENLVYSVLDKTKYASKHAVKYANKVGTGMKGKSPEEILLWKNEQISKGTLPVIGKKPVRNRHNRHNQMKRGSNKNEQKSKEVAPTVSEWVALRKLLPESEGVFCLSIRNIGVNQKKVTLEEKALYSHFAAYNIIPKSIKYSFVDSKQVTFISFGSFFNAYRAWKEKDKTIIMGNRIGLEPGGGNVKALSSDIYMVFVIHLPTGLLMSTFVTLFARFPGLICIYPRPRDHCAIISYSTLESAERACKEVTSITVNGNKQPITVKLLDERPSMPFGTVNSSLLKSVDTKPVVNSDKITFPKSAATASISPMSDSPGISSMSDSKHITPVDTETKKNTESHDKRACGFCVSYQQIVQMFKVTCRKNPNTLENVPNEIQFLVTHQIEPIRFWGWLMSGNEAVKKLNEIETNIASTVVKVQPPHVLPKEGHRGAALYKEEGKETWYRCYVLSSNSETDDIKVFYCDYGNSEVIPRGLFRSTYNDVWTLPPQAVPFKMHGFEMRDPHDLKITERLNLDDGQVLKATVVKTSLYSQPHIIEIKDVAYVSLKSSSIDEKIIGSWCIPVGNTPNGNNIGIQGGDNVDIGDKVDGICDSTHESECVITADQEENSGMESIFDYDDEDLVLGLLAEAHNPNLLYLKLGDVSQFAILQIAIDNAELILPNNMDKGDVLLLNANGQRRRVLALQVLSAFGKVKVLHVDYGVIEWVALSDLYYLGNGLQDSPFQARPAALAGIDCKEKIAEAILFLKSKMKTVIKTNVIHESTSGKVRVELFDLQTKKSINKEMIDNGLAVRVINESTDTDEELSPNMIPLPVKDLDTHVPQTGLLPLPGKTPDTMADSNIKTLLNSLKLSHHEAANSVASWNSQPHNPFQSDKDYNNQLPGYPDVPRLMDVSTWVDKSPLKGDMPHDIGSSNEIGGNLCSQDLISFEDDHITSNFGNQEQFVDKDQVGSKFGIKEQIASNHRNEFSNFQVEDQLRSNHGNKDILTGNLGNENGKASNTENEIANENISYEHFFQEGDEVITNNKDEAYPPPDIIASNKVSNIQIDQGICIDGRKIRIGEDDEVLNVDINNKLNIKQVRELRQKWLLEKENLIETKDKLEILMDMSVNDLTAYYKIIKKEKLQLKLGIKQVQKYSNKLENDYEKIILETNRILSLI